MAPPRPQRPQPTTIENLPGELLSEILIRFPAKPLARMRSVSKSWNAFLSQPSFIKSHLHRSQHNNVNDEILLLLHSGNGTYSFSVTRSPNLKFPNFIKFPDISPCCYVEDTFTFFGSVHGLICFGFRTLSNFFIKIWNPSLSAVLTLPRFNGEGWYLFDDFTYELHFRFGYDPKTDDYKLLKIMTCLEFPDPFSTPCPDFKLPKRDIVIDGDDLVDLEVYSMRKGSWKLMPHTLLSNVISIRDEEVVCGDGHDGHLHWFGNFNGNDRIVTFDLGLETFVEICFPDNRSYFSWTGLGVYSGKLCVMSFKKGFESEVWVMNEYGVAESWTKLHVFSHLRLSGDIDSYGFTWNNKFLFRTYSRPLESYNYYYSYSEDMEFYDPDAKKSIIFKIKARDRGYTRIVEYVESLVWPVAPTIVSAAEISQRRRLC